MDSSSLTDFDFDALLKESSQIFQTIHKQNLEDQAKHADPDFKRSKIANCIYEEIADGLRDKPFEQWTITDVGNIAYMALNAPVRRSDFKKVLQDYREFREFRPCFSKPVKKPPESWSSIGWIMLELVRDVVKIDAT